MTREAFEQLRGKSVEFQVRNVYLPDPVTVLSELHGEDTLTGTVIDLSDDARDEEAAFLVVQVKHPQSQDPLAEGSAQPKELTCIVPYEHARRKPDDGGGS